MRHTENELKPLFIGIADAARISGVSVDSIRRLIADGALPAARLTRGRKQGRVMLRVQALHDFLAKREADGVR